MGNVHPFYNDKDGYLNQEYFYEKGSYKDPLHKGIKLEIGFANALVNIPFFKINSWIHISDNSGIDDPINYDVTLLSYVGGYWFEVKGTDGNRIYAELTPEYIENKLYLPINCKNMQCYFAFPKYKAKDLHNPINWYIHKITPNSYLMGLHSKPYYPKLVEHSILLPNILKGKDKQMNEYIENELQQKEKEENDLKKLRKDIQDRL